MIRFLACLAIALTAMSSTASAREAILSFESDVTIMEDASLTVIETITVQADGDQIKRGIVREFPTTYKDKNGHRYRVAFDIINVKRDGRPELFHTKKRSNGVDLFTGHESYFLNHGEHRYEITYRTTRQIGFFEDYDALYWNVTGTGWRLPIDQVTYTLHLPGHAKPLDISAYTGPQGASGQDFRITADTEGLVQVVSSRRFGKREGLTVAVSFPTGLISKPSAATTTNLFFRDNASVFIGLAGLLIILGYYLYFWDRSGRDPTGGAIIPRFKPPEGFSPAAARFVHRMSYDRKAFSAAIINMAVKGYLEIDEVDGEFTLKQVGTSSEMLTSGEHRIASRLFGSSDHITLETENHKVISAAISSFESGLKSEYQHIYFITNIYIFLFGAMVSLGIIAAVSVFNAGVAPIPVSFIAQMLFAGLAAITAIVYLNFRARQTLPDVNLQGLFSRGLKGPLRYVLIGLILFPQFALGSILGGHLGLAVPVLAALIGGINGAFYVLLKAPTHLGRAILDEIEGFRLYLATAEKNRLNALNPPDKTPELFEKFLPFALALDVENEWSEQFTDVLAAAGSDGADYHPRWYHGRRWHHGNVGSFSSGLNSSFATAIASSAVAPGSSGGVGGGGFSGGGGGGGGGGGW